MAKLIFTEEDERMIESLMEEFDPAKRLAHLNLRDQVSAIEWDFLLEDERRSLLMAVKACLMAKALQPLGNDYELMGTIRESVFDHGDEMATVRRKIAIVGHVLTDAVKEWEDETWDLTQEPICRLLGLTFEPVS